MDPENVDSSKTLNVSITYASNARPDVLSIPPRQRNTKAGRKSIRELSRGKGAKKPGTPATTVGNDEVCDRCLSLRF